MSVHARLAFVVALAWSLAAAAQAPPGQSAAIEAGKAADAAALAGIVQSGDAQRVHDFMRGMALAQVAQLPPGVEALIVANFDHPHFGEALRDHSPRYNSRALFDRHYARIQAAYRADEPSFRQILRTGQPGIDEALLRIADKFPTKDPELNPVLIFAGERKHPAAVPGLLASIERGYRVLGTVPAMHNRVMSLLLGYPSVDVWRRASDELERLNREKRVTPVAYHAGREQLDHVLADPGVTLARMRRREVSEAFERRSAAVKPSASEVELLKDASPGEYVKQQGLRLTALDEIVRELDDESLAYQLGFDYLRLGLFVRFRMRDARAALPFLEKAAEARDSLGQLALADTYQLALADKPNAIRAYEMALAEASRPTQGRPFFPYTRSGSATNDFWRAWLAQEIDFLQTGRAFRGRIPENVVAGFFDLVFGQSGGLVDAFSADLAMDSAATGALRQPGYVRAMPEVQSWEDAQVSLERVDRAAAAKQLEALPASRLTLLVALRPLSALPAAQILRLLSRNDPSGYWSACAMGAVSHLASRGAAGREEAVRNGVAQAMPGFAAPGKPNALATAASRFLASRGLRVAARP